MLTLELTIQKRVTTKEKNSDDKRQDGDFKTMTSELLIQGLKL